MKNVLKKSSNKRRRAPRFRSAFAVRKEIEQLRDWATRSVDVELILFLPGATINYFGRIIATSSGVIKCFHFIDKAGIRIMLIPHWFPKSQVQNDPRELHVQGKNRLDKSFAIREFSLVGTSNRNSNVVLDKVRTWIRLKLPLHVFLNRGPHAISLVAEVKELFPGIFAFSSSPSPFQLILSIEDYEVVEVKVDGEKTSITLANSFTKEFCVISDFVTRPEILFKRFPGLGSTIQ